jgi:DGQHR domain-containing protein
VSPSLVYDLYEYTKSRSPQKTSHNIARLLNSKEESPFFQRIKILGTADPELRQVQTITQATFVEALIRLISGSNENALEDRDLLKRNKIPPMPTNEESKILIFRNLFLAKKDAEIASTIWNYFGAVKERWPEAWNNLGRQGNILPRTNGFKAFMRFLPNVYNLISDSQKVPSQSDFLRLLENISLQDEDFTSEIYKPGSSGEKLLLDHLLSLLVTYQR